MRANLNVLHDVRRVALECGIRWQCFAVYRQHDFFIDSDLVVLTTLALTTTLASFCLRRKVRALLARGFDRWLAAFSLQPIDFIPQLLVLVAQLCNFGTLGLDDIQQFLHERAELLVGYLIRAEAFQIHATSLPRHTLVWG